jgi:rRNA maturation endonuclease Nob1
MSYSILHLFVAILDTAALLAWPVERLSQGIVAISQLKELEKVSVERSMLIESIDLIWISPSEKHLKQARDAAIKSGDLTRLSGVDIDIIALCFQLDQELYTDDYRIQNTLTKAGKTWKSVVQTGISGVWVWMQICTGCGKSEPSKADSKDSDCGHCGSPLKLKKKKR